MLSLDEKIGQLVLVGFHGLEPPAYVLEWLAAGRLGGVILFGRNIESPAQVAALTQACHEAAPRPILIGIDQEGGVVARLREADGFCESPGALALGAADDETLAENVSAALGEELRALGINWNYAPVVDLTYSTDNPSVGTRSLGTDPARVTALARAQVRGFQRAGVMATPKHFPGIGNTPVDSHLAMPVIEAAPDYLWERDFAPYRALAQEAGSVMIGHIKFAALDAEYPATLSPRIVTGLLREELGFTGMASTDCMEMRAISDHYSPGESAVLAVLAGIDTVLFSHSFFKDEARHAGVHDALRAAAESGRLPEAQIDAAVARVQAAARRFAIDGPLQPDRLMPSERVALMDRAARAGAVLLRAEADIFPLRPEQHAQTALIEIASYMDSEVVEQGAQTKLAALLAEQAPAIRSVALKAVRSTPESVARARVLAAEAEIVVLATRNAHLIQPELDFARELMQTSQRVILVCLKNPYDAAVLPEAGTVVCTNGDSAPSIRAAADALLGRFTPTGKLPVPLD